MRHEKDDECDSDENDDRRWKASLHLLLPLCLAFEQKNQ